MLDIKLIRENPELVKEGIRKKRELDALPLVDELLRLDERRRELLAEVESLRSQQKKLAKAVGQAKRSGDSAEDLLAKSAELAEYLKRLEAEEKRLEEQIQTILPQIPNLPHPSVPVGESEADNVVVKEWGEKPSFDFEARPHWEIAADIGAIDFERGAKVSGSGFPFYLGQGARLVRALENFFLNFHTARGFIEVRPPLLVREQAAFGTGQLPDKEGMMYEVSGGYYLIPTSEVPVTNLHAGEILPAEKLPLKYTAYTPNFRVEAGSYGKDVRGLNRLHQFDKVEMVVFSHPDESYDWLERLTRQAEELLEALGLPYRRLLMCTADMGFTQAKKYDLEVWSAGQQKWLEVSSISNMEDYQARRMKTRFREPGGKPRLVHTLNGSGLAFPRVMAALIENNQTASGGFELPEALQPYLR
ncbi:serine--tRNA ligase [Oceanithermus sp.]